MYDAQIREPLFDYLDEKYPKNRIFEEKIMGKSRADIVMVLDGSLAGLEIKSDADTYDRLETQVKDYDKFCDITILWQELRMKSMWKSMSRSGGGF